MEPLKPVHRDALKDAHPGLRDDIIDQAEQLLSQRFQLDPENEPLRIQEIDRQREALLQKEMPQFSQALQKLFAEETSNKP